MPAEKTKASGSPKSPARHFWMPYSLIAARVRHLVVVTRNVADFKRLGVEALNPFVTARR